ncbi:hypothetical protein [Williamsia maris]|uniref:Uncharacterized protein n=1 Tax=Williamsia maris TaxID=72806 RepID=A0ABT1HJC7_9NOCA|nr:hypothetical protein [Williamsia maris]MCP2178027.1 hypothetical protein [Williamsia maris]
MSAPHEHRWLRPKPIHHTWTAQSGSTQRLTAATAAAGSRLAAAGVVLGVVGATTAASLIIGVDHYPWSVAAAGAFSLVTAATVGLQARRDIAPRSYPGAQWAAGAGSDSLVVSIPVATVIADHAALRHVRLLHRLCERIDTTAGHFVELRR